MDERAVTIPLALGVGPGICQTSAWWGNATNTPPVLPPWSDDNDGDGIENGIE
mgnify:CR=1 FL=1